MHRDENENFFFQSRVSRREREIENHFSLYCSIEVYNSTVFAFLARGESWTAVQHSDWLHHSRHGKILTLSDLTQWLNLVDGVSDGKLKN